MTGMHKEDFVSAIKTQGYYISHNVLSSDDVKSLKTQLEYAIENDKRLYSSQNYKDYGMVMLCSLYGGDFISLFDNKKLTEPFEWILGEGCIVYAYTSSSMPPKGSNYSNRIHVDCPRLITNYITNMGATILLDDFTFENGATQFLPYSQNRLDSPSAEEFSKSALMVVAPAGSVFYFNARLWHSGGENQTDRWRHALTINMCRSYMKQRIDIPRAMINIPTEQISEKAQQKLGFHSQPPTSMEEYYKPLSERSFKQTVE